MNLIVTPEENTTNAEKIDKAMVSTA